MLSKRLDVCLGETSPAGKSNLILALADDLRRGEVEIDRDATVEARDSPGIPLLPEIVRPQDLPGRRLNDHKGHAAFIHAVAHIEFTAMNLALDAAQRFRGMPEDYYRDWLMVAAEEAIHFGLLSRHLETLGVAYGDFPAQGSMWHTALATAHDVLVRMAIVPRGLEARGLDVTPGMIQKLEALGDRKGADILRRILADEIGHVAVGSKWFRWCCEERGLDSEQTFIDLVAAHLGPLRAGELHREARLDAGFTSNELHALAAMKRP